MGLETHPSHHGDLDFGYLSLSDATDDGLPETLTPEHVPGASHRLHCAPIQVPSEFESAFPRPGSLASSEEATDAYIAWLRKQILERQKSVLRLRYSIALKRKRSADLLAKNAAVEHGSDVTWSGAEGK